MTSELQKLSKPLDAAESKECRECEEIIRQGWDTFLEVGRALTIIRHKRLYRDRYETFEEYCRQRWQFSKTHANRLIEAAAVAAALTPIGVKLKSESQVRPLVGLAPHKIPTAWKKAVELAGEGEITAKIVRRATEEINTNSMKSGENAPANKNGRLLQELELALSLVDKAEVANKEGNPQAVFDALENLRKCLSDCWRYARRSKKAPTSAKVRS